MIAFLDWLNGILWGVPLIALMIITGVNYPPMNWQACWRPIYVT